MCIRPVCVVLRVFSRMTLIREASKVSVRSCAAIGHTERSSTENRDMSVRFIAGANVRNSHEFFVFSQLIWCLFLNRWRRIILPALK